MIKSTPAFRALLASLALGCALSPSSPANEIGLIDGEKFTYRVGWGIFGRAGDITVSASELPGPQGPQIRLRTETSTHGFIRALYPFDGQADMFYESESGRFIRATAQTESRSKETSAKMDFDYESSEAIYTDLLRPERSLTIPIPANNPADFVTTLIQTRSWKMKLGESREVSVLFDDEFYELVITAEAEEVIKTKWGKKRTLVLVPRMPGEPKGMFKRGGEVRVWVSQEEDHLPVRFEVKMKVGTGMAVLTDYEKAPPPAPPAAPTNRKS